MLGPVCHLSPSSFSPVSPLTASLLFSHLCGLGSSCHLQVVKMERWLNGEEHPLLFQRTQVWCPKQLLGLQRIQQLLPGSIGHTHPSPHTHMCAHHTHSCTSCTHTFMHITHTFTGAHHARIHTYTCAHHPHTCAHHTHIHSCTLHAHTHLCTSHTFAYAHTHLCTSHTHIHSCTSLECVRTHTHINKSYTKIFFRSGNVFSSCPGPHSAVVVHSDCSAPSITAQQIHSFHWAIAFAVHLHPSAWSLLCSYGNSVFLYFSVHCFRCLQSHPPWSVGHGVFQLSLPLGSR